MSAWLRQILLVYLPKILFMKRPDMPSRYVYVKERLESTSEDQRSTYQWKDEERKRLVKITADHIAYIAGQIENAKNEKEVRLVFIGSSPIFFVFRSSKNGVSLR
jgi:hypothetical protein